MDSMQSTLLVGSARPGGLGGMYRLAAGSADWQHLGGGLPDKLQVNCIVQRPGSPSEIFIGTHSGLFHSTDGGDHWTEMGLAGEYTAIYSILLHPSDPDTIYAGMDGTVIHKSEDGGATWRKLAAVQPEGAITGCFPVRVLRMAADPANPEEVYAALEVGGAIRSLDGGATWEDISQGLLDLSTQPHLRNHILSDDDTEGMMDVHAVAVSAEQPGKVWAANRMGLFVSEDKGKSWAEFGIGRFSDLTYGRDLMVSPHDSTVFLAALSDSSRGVAGSLYRSEDTGATWQRLDHDVSIESTLMTVSVDPGDPGRVVCASRLGQVFGTEDGGATWQSCPLPDGVEDVRAVVSV